MGQFRAHLCNVSCLLTLNLSIILCQQGHFSTEIVVATIHRTMWSDGSGSKFTSFTRTVNKIRPAEREFVCQRLCKFNQSEITLRTSGAVWQSELIISTGHFSSKGINVFYRHLLPWMETLWSHGSWPCTSAGCIRNMCDAAGRHGQLNIELLVFTQPKLSKHGDFSFKQPNNEVCLHAVMQMS